MTYTERLWAPLMWWVIACAFGLTFVIAIGAILPVQVAIVSLVVAVALIVGVLVGTAPTVGVTPAGVVARGAVLPWACTGPVRTLSGEELKRRIGVDADPRAYLVYRAFCDSAVEIEVADEQDPHPYWLVSTRNPDAFAAAIKAATAADRRHVG